VSPHVFARVHVCACVHSLLLCPCINAHPSVRPSVRLSVCLSVFHCTRVKPKAAIPSDAAPCDPHCCSGVPTSPWCGGLELRPLRPCNLRGSDAAVYTPTPPPPSHRGTAMGQDVLQRGVVVLGDPGALGALGTRHMAARQRGCGQLAPGMEEVRGIDGLPALLGACFLFPSLILFVSPLR
jgi:hypothetical protein